MCVYFVGFSLITKKGNLVSAELLGHTVSQPSNEKPIRATGSRGYCLLGNVNKRATRVKVGETPFN